jgi:hypothetical protein
LRCLFVISICCTASNPLTAQLPDLISVSRPCCTTANTPAILRATSRLDADSDDRLTVEEQVDSRMVAGVDLVCR